MAPPPVLKTMLCERISDGAVLLSYNTSKRSNAFDPQQYNDLREGLVWARDEEDVIAVVVTGKGKHYCAGRAMTSGDNTITAEVAAGSALSSVLNPYPKILIAAVHGAAIGWGCTQLSSFDLIYAHSQTAFFQTPFASLGIAPEGGSSYNFPRAMGKARAGALLFAGERLSAEEAWIGGLITSAIKAESVEGFLEQVLDKARRIGEFSKEALVLAKGLVREAEGKGAVEARRRAGEKERDGVLRMFETEDTQRRLAGFGAGKTKARI